MDEIETEAKRLKPVLVIIDYAQQVAPVDAKTPRYLTISDVGQRAIALARSLDCAALIASQVNVIRGERGSIQGYSLRETAMLEHCAHVVLVFEIEYETVDGQRMVKASRIVVQKARGFAPFRIDVAYFPHLFLIEDAVMPEKG
jgi:predicted ATP-dependent serine protease